MKQQDPITMNFRSVAVGTPFVWCQEKYLKVTTQDGIHQETGDRKRFKPFSDVTLTPEAKRLSDKLDAVNAVQKVLLAMPAFTRLGLETPDDSEINAVASNSLVDILGEVATSYELSVREKLGVLRRLPRV